MASEFLSSIGKWLGCFRSCSSFDIINSISEVYYKVYHQGGVVIRASQYSGVKSVLKLMRRAEFVAFSHTFQLVFSITIAAAPKHPILKELLKVMGI